MSWTIDDLLQDFDRLKDLEFEDGLKLLEEIVSRLNNREIKLSELVKYYDLGTRLSEFLFNQLRGAEEQIKVFRLRGNELVEEIHKAEELIDEVKNTQSAR